MINWYLIWSLWNTLNVWSVDANITDNSEVYVCWNDCIYIRHDLLSNVCNISNICMYICVICMMILSINTQCRGHLTDEYYITRTVLNTWQPSTRQDSYHMYWFRVCCDGGLIFGDSVSGYCAPYLAFTDHAKNVGTFYFKLDMHNHM